MKDEHKLDNPVWHALNEVHKHLAIQYKGAKFYIPEYCKFGSSIESNALEILKSYAELTPSFFIVGKKPICTETLVLKKEIVCNQMVFSKQVEIKINIKIVELKTDKEKSDLFDLVLLVQPGYFVKGTIELGQYFGIYQEDQLIAVIGERMKMNYFTEISSVITHPDFTRRGYAKQLFSYMTHKIRQEGKTPFLHVVETNEGAIRLYELLGFFTRKKMVFWNLQVVADRQSL